MFLSNAIDRNRLLGQEILGCAKNSGREQDIAIIYLTDACQMTETQRKLIAGDITHAVKQRKIVLLPTCQWDKIENSSQEGEAVMDILFRLQQKIRRKKLNY